MWGLQRCAIYAGVLCTAFAAPSWAQLSNDNSPWEMFASRLVKRLAVQDSNGKITNFQLVKQPTSADWADPKIGASTFHDFAAKLTNPGEFYATSDLTLFGQFELFLNSLDLPPANEATRPAMERARTQYLESLSGFRKIVTAANKEWARFDKEQAALPPQRRTPYEIWEAREFGPKMGTQEQVIKERAYEYAKLLSDTYKGFSGIGGLITGMTNTAYRTRVTLADGKPQDVPSFALNADLAKFIAKGDANAGFEETWGFDKSHERRALSWSSRSGGAGVKVGWFSFGASGGGRKETLDITKDSIAMTVKFKNFTTFSITPGPWFSGDAVKAMWEGPYKAGAIASKAKLFGPDGSFRPRVAQVVLVHRPTVTMKLDASQYSKVVESWNGSGGVGIGPFGFRGKASGGKDELIEDKANNTLTIEDKTGIPQIVAIFTVSYPQ